ncbi:MAG: hypothetical protein JSR55_15970 [Proteobacteria bacterium]|nr:hypothetical protein [Pseudomonadota bacterium]
MKFTVLALSAAMALAPVAVQAADIQAAPASQQQSALAPGSAAGVHQAQSWQDNQWTYILLGAVIVGGAIWAVSSGGGHHHSTNSTTGNP